MDRSSSSDSVLDLVTSQGFPMYFHRQTTPCDRVAMQPVRTTGVFHPIELELPSLRIVLESEIPEAEWVRARYEQLALLDETRLAALHHVQVYQKKIARHFNKKVRPNKQRVSYRESL